MDNGWIRDICGRTGEIGWVETDAHQSSGIIGHTDKWKIISTWTKVGVDMAQIRSLPIVIDETE